MVTLSLWLLNLSGYSYKYSSPWAERTKYYVYTFGVNTAVDSCSLELVGQWSDSDMLKAESEFTMIQRRGHRNLKQRFELVKTLGQGTYGKVKLAIEKKTGRQVRIIIFVRFETMNYVTFGFIISIPQQTSQ